MVKITDYSKRVNSDGEEFFALILQGDLELVKSQQTGRYYATSNNIQFGNERIIYTTEYKSGDNYMLVEK